MAIDKKWKKWYNKNIMKQLILGELRDELAQAKKKEHLKLSVRAKVGHVFAVIKNLFNYRKTRYQGNRKQTAKLNMLFALANLYLADKRSGLSV